MNNTDNNRPNRLGSLGARGLGSKGQMLDILRADGTPFVPQMLEPDALAARVEKVRVFLESRNLTCPNPCTVPALVDSNSQFGAIRACADALADALVDAETVTMNGVIYPAVRLIVAIAARTHADQQDVNWLHLLASFLPDGWTVPERSVGGRPSVSVTPEQLRAIRTARIKHEISLPQLRRILAILAAELAQGEHGEID